MRKPGIRAEKEELILFDHVITPRIFSDTYLLRLAEEPKITLQSTETVDYAWLTPVELLERCRAGMVIGHLAERFARYAREPGGCTPEGGRKMNKHHRTLELDRVLEMLAEQATCAASKELALRLEPVITTGTRRMPYSGPPDINTLTARYGTPGLGGIQDCTGALQRAKLGSRLSAGEILQVARVLRTIRTIKKWRGQGETPTAADDLFHVLAPVEGLEKDIFDAILSEEEIADTASSALNDLRRRIRRAQLKVREQLDGIIRSPQYAKALQEPIITMRDGRFVVPVKIECKNEVKGLVHDTSSSGATVFIEPMAVVDANNEIRMLQNEEQLEIDRILQEFSERIGQVADATRDSFAALLQLDLLFAKSRLADKMKATVPDLNEDGIIEFRKARHPLIQKDKVVPVDIRLGDGFDTLVITGPNTGGKTVALKTLGLLTLMAACGMMLPVATGSPGRRSLPMCWRILATSRA